MTHGLDLPLPTARALHGWWRELADLRPRRLWYGRLYFHHLEALVETAHETSLDPLQRALLQALAADLPSSSFDPQLQARLLSELAKAGLLDGTDAAPTLTALGRAALATGSFVSIRRSRRSFWFVDNTVCGTSPCFLQPRRPLATAKAPEGWTFPVEELSACVQRPAEWKQRHGYPADVRAIIDLAAAPGDWRAVALDRAEQFLGIVVEPEGAALTAFSIRPDVMGLERDRPAFTLAAGWEEVLPDLAVEPALEEWRQAWLTWCAAHGIPEADTCAVARESLLIQVRAPKNVVERLQTARGEPLKNEAWLLAGTGRFRAAAMFEVIEI